MQACTFRVDYTLENIPGREFGSVFVGEKSENVALKVVSEGWAKVLHHHKVSAHILSAVDPSHMSSLAFLRQY